MNYRRNARRIRLGHHLLTSSPSSARHWIHSTARPSGVGGPAHWQPSHQKRHSRVSRPAHLRYVADTQTLSTSQDRKPTCSKAQSTRFPVPRPLVICCGNVILISLMPDSWSPRTIFELLYKHSSPRPPPAPSSITGATSITTRCPASPASSSTPDSWSLYAYVHLAERKNCSLAYSTRNLGISQPATM